MQWMFLARLVLVCFASLALLPASASAQAAASGIAGVVKDTSGAVMPGVTVEAASPALIEKVRSVVTDGQGQYKIVDLRPGVYTVTFTLPGFNTFRRDGLDLPPGFTATVNAEMRVGSARGDGHGLRAPRRSSTSRATRDQKVLSQAVLEALPAQRNPNSYTPLLPGVVGQSGPGRRVRRRCSPSTGAPSAPPAWRSTGSKTNSMAANGAGFIYYLNMASIQESSVTISGESAELQKSGVRNNIVPKAGGNKFSGFLFVGGGSQATQSDNLTDELRARG